MNTAKILERCRYLPGVTVKMNKAYAELWLSNDNGTGRMRFIPMFPGITIAAISVNAASWPAPVLKEAKPEAKGPLIVNYCICGRCELVLNDNKSVFLTSGQISLTEKFAQNKYIYPGGLYEGIELFIDPEAVQNGVAALSEDFGLHIEELVERYCADGETFIAELPLPEALVKRLYSFSAPEDVIGTVGMKTGVIELLALLLHGQPVPENKKLTYYTRFQVEIAKQIEAVIREDLSRRHTVRELSGRFSASESSIKNYFYGVYGQSISQYAAHQRMEYAAELLSETNLSVIEISHSVGDESQSKFAAAFCREYGVAPVEYRRRQNLTDHSGEYGSMAAIR